MATGTALGPTIHKLLRRAVYQREGAGCTLLLPLLIDICGLPYTLITQLDGNSRPSFTAHMVAKQAEHDFDDKETGWLIATM